MSAFIVSRRHIQFLVQSMLNYHQIAGSPDLAGQTLWDENIKSVQYRYDDKPIADLPGPRGETYLYQHVHCPHFAPKPVEIIKQCHCYSYQSCEHPAWEQSQAKRIVDRLIDEAIVHLPGYDAAPWGIN